PKGQPDGGANRKGSTGGNMASEEMDEQGGIKKPPCPIFWRTAEDVAKQLLGLGAVEKVLLVRSTLVGVSGRDGDAIDAQSLHVVEECGNAFRLGIVEERTIDVDPEAFCLRLADRCDSLCIDARLAHRPVVHLSVAVEVYRPIEASVRPILLKLFVHQQRIGANRDELTFGECTCDDLRQLLVQERLSTSEDHHRRSTLIDRLHAIGNREPLVQNLIWVIDLAAT